MSKKNFPDFIPKFLSVILLLSVISYLHKIHYFSTSIEKVIPSQSWGDYRGDPLLKGDKVLIDYYSDYPKLGTVGIKFNTFYRINSDTIRFRIQEVGQNRWHYEHDYKVDQFQPGSAFPFGFPMIEDSSEKYYRVEIESLSGTKENSVAIASPLDQPVVAKHIFNKQQLLKDLKLLLYIVYHKIIFLVTDRNFLGYFFTHSLPLIYYYLYCFMGFGTGTFSMVIFVSILVDSLLITGFNSFFIISVLFGWGLMVYHRKVESKVSAVIFMNLAALSAMFYLFGSAVLSNKLLVWAFLFLVFSVSQTIYQINVDTRKQLSLKNYYYDLILDFKNEASFVYMVIIGEISITAERVWLDATGRYEEAEKLWKRFYLPGAKKGGSWETIALVVYRSTAPMVKTYIYATRIISYLIIALVWIVASLIRFGHFILLGWIFWLNLRQALGYHNFFRNFFVQDQNSIFWDQFGINMLFVYSLVIIILIAISFLSGLDLRKKTILGVISLYAGLTICRTLFNFATPYRDEVKIWSINPSNVSEPWTDVVVTGRNLGEMPFAGEVLVNGVQQRMISWKKDQVIFRTNPSTTRSGFLEIRNYNKMISTPIPFTYTGNR